MRYKEIIKESKDPTSEDLTYVAEWMNTTVDNLIIEQSWQPMSTFEQDAKEMYDSYDEFPLDMAKTEYIREQIQLTGKLYPMYVEKDDIHNFVMEGRHRMVAFYLEEMDAVPVAYVSLHDHEAVTEGVGIIDAQNSTVDVKPGETTRQANKFNLALDNKGHPKLLRP